MIENIKFIGPSRITDTEEHFFSELLVNIRHADPDYHITIDKGETVKAHVKPSNPEFKQEIIHNLLFFNRQKRMYRIHFSKSLAISSTISFEIY